MLEHLSVKWALIMNALISCVVLIISICLMRDRHIKLAESGGGHCS
jgi:preprotein translocase subunit SecG